MDSNFALEELDLAIYDSTHSTDEHHQYQVPSNAYLFTKSEGQPQVRVTEFQSEKEFDVTTVMQPEAQRGEGWDEGEVCEELRVNLVKMIEEVLEEGRTPTSNVYEQRLQEIVLSSRVLFEDLVANKDFGYDYLFKTSKMRRCMDVFIQMLFADRPPEALSLWLKLRCCEGRSEHTQVCREEWDKVRDLLRVKVMERVRRKPVYEFFLEED